MAKCCKVSKEERNKVIVDKVKIKLEYRNKS